MSTTPRDLRRRVEDVQDDMAAQYGSNTPFCEMAHMEFEIPRTPLPDEEIARIREQLSKVGVMPDEDSLKLTEEHRDFHDAMRRLVIGFQSDGADAVQMLSAALAIGRRIGMADAVAAMGNTWEVD